MMENDWTFAVTMLPAVDLAQLSITNELWAKHWHRIFVGLD
jgi:hypothetical protein